MLAISYGPIRHTNEYCISYFGLSKTLPNIIIVIPVTGFTVETQKRMANWMSLLSINWLKTPQNSNRVKKVISFLYKQQLFGDKPFGNDYTVLNYLQGKMELMKNGRVSTSLVVGSDTFANKMTIADFQKKINQALAKPISNDTDVQNEANF